VSLLAVPGAAAGSAQVSLQGDQVFEQFSGLSARRLLALASCASWFFLFELAWRHCLDRLLGDRKTLRHVVGIHNRKSVWRSGIAGSECDATLDAWC